MENNTSLPCAFTSLKFPYKQQCSLLHSVFNCAIFKTNRYEISNHLSGINSKMINGVLSFNQALHFYFILHHCSSFGCTRKIRNYNANHFQISLLGHYKGKITGEFNHVSIYLLY